MNDLQSAIIYRIIQLTEWPNEKALESINIGVYNSSSTFITKLEKSYLKRKIRGKPLSISPFDPFISNNQIQVLIIKNNKRVNLKNISDRLKGRNILLISESNSEKKHLMVNLFTSDEGHLAFEINRPNILLANLKISKDIILAGGSELDVAEIYDQAVTDLSKTQDELIDKTEEIQQQSQLLKQQQVRIDKLDLAIKKQKIKLNKQNKSILTKDKELDAKEGHLRTLENDLKAQIKIIDNSTQALESIESNLIISSQSLANQEVQNLTLTEKIEANLKVLDHQKKQLSKKELTIRTQKSFLIVSILFGSIFFILIIALYRLFIAKKKASISLENKNQQLEKIMRDLHQTQDQLIESEKMASMGGMVAGIAHEVNTPAGIVLTVDTSLLENTQLLKEKISKGAMAQQDLDEYLDYSIECNTMSIKNIKRVAGLIKTFKQVAVDQANNEFCSLNLKEYIDEILASLQYLFEGNKHEIEVTIENDITFDSYPAVYLQVIQTLITNSLMHGFDEMELGKIDLSFAPKGECLIFEYKDNGKGASQEVIDKIFDPFYTTKRGSGSSGLGTHILYNLVTQLLKGKVSCRQNQPEGLIFKFELPLQLYPQSELNPSLKNTNKKAATLEKK